MSATRIFLALLLALTARAQTTGWKLVWSDEFSGTANTAPDSTKWGYDLGGGGWGNSELETYTNSTTNSFQDGQGHLVIQALSSNGSYTSARLKTLGKYNFTYGKVEARIKLPYAQGIWPAFWMLGSNPNLVWPAIGEIDIAENFGVKNNDAFVNHGSIHGPNFIGSLITQNFTLPGTAPLSADFHLFAIDWEPGRIEFFVDGHSYLVTTPASLPPGGQWVFDNNAMYILLNVAVGGTPAPVGNPDSTTVFPQQMLVDYVRVYQQVTVDATTPNITPNGVVDAASSAPVAAAGGLATIYGQNLADATYDSSVLFSSGAFSTSTSSGVGVSVDGAKAPLIYVSPTQINYQIPWEASTGPAPVNVTVSRGSVVSYAEPFSVAKTSPTTFPDYTAGTTLVTGCNPSPGATCVMWGNGFGPTNQAQQDGIPASTTPSSISQLEVASACGLTIDNQPATVLYCGAAPGEVIDQLNFTYPATISGTGTSVAATLTIDQTSESLTLPVAR